MAHVVSQESFTGMSQHEADVTRSGSPGPRKGLPGGGDECALGGEQMFSAGRLSPKEGWPDFSTDQLNKPGLSTLSPPHSHSHAEWPGKMSSKHRGEPAEERRGRRFPSGRA